MRDLIEALTAILPEGVAVGSSELVALPSLWPGESVPGAVPMRQREFVSGRSAARNAFVKLGLPMAAIPMGADRAPVWPEGVAGSISHCEGAYLSIAARQNAYAALGLDIEPAVALPSEVWPTVLRPEETVYAAQNGLAALQIFVAKEAAYKAQYPISRQLFDFQTLRVTVRMGDFSAIFTKDVGPFARGYILSGKVVTTDKFSAAVCWIAQSNRSRNAIE